MTISANVTVQKITASASGSGVTATVSPVSISAAANGGVGPAGGVGATGSQGPAGATGATGPQGPSGVTTLAGASDVAISGLAVGDVLRYGSSGKWNNYPDSSLVDGGNW